LAFAVNAIGGLLDILFGTLNTIVGVIGDLVKGIADFLTGTGEAETYQKSLDKKYGAGMGGELNLRPDQPIDQNNPLIAFANWGASLFGERGFAPAIPSQNPMNDKYTIVIGGKAVDGVVKDSLGRIIANTNPAR
jgi:hypothetical protein